MFFLKLGMMTRFTYELQVYFCAQDVCSVLKYKHKRDAILKHVSPENRKKFAEWQIASNNLKPCSSMKLDCTNSFDSFCE